MTPSRNIEKLLFKLEKWALSKEITDRCPIVVRENVSYKDVINEIDYSDEDGLGMEKACIGCPFHIKAPDYFNCSLIAQEISRQRHGFSAEEVGKMLGISESAVLKLEVNFLTKLMRNIFDEPAETKEQREFRKYLKQRYNIK